MKSLHFLRSILQKIASLEKITDLKKHTNDVLMSEYLDLGILQN